MEDGFTLVRPHGRRREASEKTVVFTAGGAGGEVGNDQRVLRPLGDVANIPVSNIFERLGEDMESDVLRGEVQGAEANKENEETVNKVQGRRNDAQGRGGLARGQLNVSRSGCKSVMKEKRNGPKKVGEENGPRPRLVKQHQPTPGLVFGPMRGELEMSANGKRLRVERESWGRSGGAFVNNEKGLIGVTKSGLDRIEDVGLQQTGQSRSSGEDPMEDRILQMEMEAGTPCSTERAQ